MQIRVSVFLLLLVLGIADLRAQVEPDAGPAQSGQTEETVDSNEAPAGEAVATTSTATVSIAVTTTPPPWISLVRIAAVAGPFAFLVLAWMIGAFVHYRLVRHEHEQFPAMRGSRSPQTTPMIISAALFFVPAALFIFFEIRSRQELLRGTGGVIDQWLPVTTQAWTALLVCLVLALMPWLFARRADKVA